MAIAANPPEAAVDPSNAIYVNQGDDEPVQMESLCMNCHENVCCNPELAVDVSYPEDLLREPRVCRVQPQCS